MSTVLRPFQGSKGLTLLPGATRFASLHACPWLLYAAPLALADATFRAKPGIDCERQTVAEGRDNVIGIVYASGEKKMRNGLMLNSHMDTVPVENMSIAPFDPTVKPTLNVGKMAGGQSVNIVPDQCVLEIERRLLPGEDAEQTLQDCSLFVRENVGEGVQFTMEPPYLIDPALETPGDAPIVRSLGLARQAELGSAGELEGANYGTDGSKLARAGIHAIVCGPGDIAQAHTAAEFVEIEQVELATRIYGRLLSNWHETA